jgi:membrane protein YdbS with pleckstrin-like domain
MKAILLSVHVIAAILAVGPIAIAGSMFPRFADQAAGQVLHRICTTYAVIGIAVPLLGSATAAAMGVLTQTWVVISIALTAVAAAVLALSVLPAQRRALAGNAPAAKTLGMSTGIFNLLWVAVTVCS